MQQITGINYICTRIQRFTKVWLAFTIKKWQQEQGTIHIKMYKETTYIDKNTLLCIEAYLRRLV